MRKIDLIKVQELLDKGCTLKEIHKYLYPEWKAKCCGLAHYLNYRKIKLNRPKCYFQPVKNILMLYKHLDELKEGKITVSQLSEKCGIRKSRVNRMLRKLNVAIPKNVYYKHLKQIIPIEEFKGHLQETEEALVKQFSKEGELFKLVGYGCDFLYKNNGLNILIECKGTFSKYCTSSAILQLLYAKGLLESDKNMNIDELWVSYLKDSNQVKDKPDKNRYLTHFNVKSVRL